MKLSSLHIFLFCCFFILFHKCSSSSVSGFLDNPQYEIKFDRAIEPLDPSIQYLQMTSAPSGRKYNCVLPNVSQVPEAPSEKIENPALLSPEAILAPLKGKCIYRVTGWWTYEYCVGDFVRQFHKDKDVVIEYYLGKTLYTQGIVRDTSNEAPQTPQVHTEPDDSSQPNTDTQVNQDVKPLEGSYITSEEPYFEQYFTDGTACDLTGKKRSTSVRYVCGDGDVTYLSGVDEPSTCHYLVTISTPLLCQLPSYNTNAEANHIIICYEQFERGESLGGEGNVQKQVIADDSKYEQNPYSQKSLDDNDERQFRQQNGWY
eukprot:TRINITY_DN3151_c0_g1_i2.p1 TRINITY_DN3151_c0_g1~~TRINITY_DN3151_c0_g1_i2.p1  ORF type:complete len:327 (-),score=50.27 TRINITY_DN3151_c0_g1_i2:48-995(-)